MAVKGVISYAEAQTGAHQVTVLPDGRGSVLETTERLPAPPVAPASPAQAAEVKPSPAAATDKTSLRMLAEEYRAQNQHLEPSTLRIWDYRLEMLGKELSLDHPLRDLTVPKVRRLRGELAKRLAHSTVNDIIGKVLRPLVALGMETGAITKSPLEGIKALEKIDPEREQPT